jgi:hypothetical protein
MTPEPTGSGTGTITETAQQAATTVEGLVRRVGEVRDEVQIVGQDAEGLHGELQTQALDARTAQLAQRSPMELLGMLAEEFGLSWTLIAKLLGVSPTSVRKWRRGETLTPENRRGVARLVAFLQVLQEAAPNICDPASWLEIRISDEAIVTPADLYVMGRCELLLDLAGFRYAPHEVLYALDPKWRQRYAPDERHTVIIAPDGQPSIVAREPG